MRWEATKDERDRAEEASTPLTPREAARVLLRSPQILPDSIRLAFNAARQGVWTSPGLRNTLNSERVLQAVPGLPRGAAHWAAEQPFLGVLLSHLTPGSEVLDLGCGSGRLARHIAPRVHHLICADVSKVMLRDARGTLANHDNVEYLLLDGRTIKPVGDEAADVVYAHAVFYLHDLTQLLGLFDEVRRVLRRGGVSVMSFRTIDVQLWASQALEDARRAMRRGLGGGRFRPYTIAQIEAMLGLVGLPVTDQQLSDDKDSSGYVLITAVAT